MTMTTTSAYSGRVTNWPLFATAAFVSAGLLVVVGFDSAHPVALLVPAVVVALVTLALSSIALTVGDNGVQVRYGIFGLPRFRFETHDIRTAEALDVPRRQMGGWGLHYSPWRGTRMTVRSGPTLQLRLINGSTVAISARDPQTAAGVVNRSLG